MPRLGVSYEEVAAAAAELVADQLKPTLTAVRERLGNTGSMNTIHRHLNAWLAQHKGPARKIAEPNSRLLAALGTELSKVAEEAAADAEANLAQALSEMATLTANGEALEAERDKLAEQVVQLTSDRDRLAGQASERADEVARLTQEIERERGEIASVRRLLAQAELRLEAVPRLEQELAQLREKLADEQRDRTAADKASAVAEAQRAAAENACQQAEARLVAIEQREIQARSELAAAHAAHQGTRERLTETVGTAAAAQAELKALREQAEARQSAQQDVAPTLQGEAEGSSPTKPSTTRKR